MKLTEVFPILKLDNFTGNGTVPHLGNSPLAQATEAMCRHGAKRVVFKLLSNNDNSKNQVYFGSDFDVLRLIPHGDLVGEQTKDKGLMFKAPLQFSWVDIHSDMPPAPAPGSQLILYPKYPEVRMSGFLRGCSNAPNELMRAPTPEERALREHTPRCLILGICDEGKILAYLAHWTSDLARDAKARIEGGLVENVATVFYELEKPLQDSRERLLAELAIIYQRGPIRSGRLDRFGVLQEYQAKNGAGYTLESLFNIIPNGRSEPDYLGWELKSHGGGPVTLMTPEPDSGSYRSDLGHFLDFYGKSSATRKDFTGKHLVNVEHDRSGLTLRMEGFDPDRCEVTDPEGGLILRDSAGNIAAGWTFNKMLTHWAKKHAQAAYVSYQVVERDVRYYQYGPEIQLCKGAGLKPFLEAMYTSTIYYDPGIKMELKGDRWVSKKRNQFRIAWKNIGKLYESSELVVLE